MHEGKNFITKKLERLSLGCASFYKKVYDNAGIQTFSGYQIASLFLPILLVMIFGVAKVHAQSGIGVSSVALSTRGHQTVLLSSDGSVWGLGVNSNGSLGD